MEYIMSCCNALNGCYLSKSVYGNLRAALFHVFRLHNHLGFPDAFCLELGNLYHGFFRQLTRQNPAPPAPDQPNGNPGNGAPVVVPHPQREKEGKAPMSVELYRHVCRWFVDWGTLDGIFAHTFTILSWNLACCANNTAKIHLRDIEWASTFDAYGIFFAHTKTDQTGEEAKYSQHVYANPTEPLVCPVLTLAFYFSCCLNVRPTADEFIFPGNDQYQ